jgi:CxxC-x17-CxxC domain-containing protein
MAEFQDRTLKCVDCGADFTFTAGEQQFYHEKDFKNEPKRCKSCKLRKNSGTERMGSGRVETSATCSQCGRDTTVPFRPTQGRPVFCRQCFQGRKVTGVAAGA